MAKIVKAWVYDVLNSYSLGELQSGVRLAKPVRIDRRSDKDHPFQIEVRPYKVRGTGIPASTLKKLLNRTIAPGPTTLKKLRLFNDRMNYNLLKTSGASSSEARRLYRQPRVEEAIQLYRDVVATIAENKDIDPDIIIYGLTQSERQIDDWDQYIRSKKFTPESAPIDDDDWEMYMESGYIA